MRGITPKVVALSTSPNGRLIGRRLRRLPSLRAIEWAGWSRGDPWTITSCTIVVVLSVAIVIQPLIVIWLSLQEGRLIDREAAYSLRNYVDVFGDRFTYGVLANTFGLAAVSLTIALAFGLPAAWLAERTDLPGKPLLFTLMTMGLLVPGFATAMGWLFILHPRIGLGNNLLQYLFGLSEPPFNIATIAGMGWVQGLNLVPIMFLMTAASFRAIDPALEESAEVSGLRCGEVLWTVTLPLAWPGILAAAIYVFTISFAAFDVPAIIGWSNRIFTFSTFVVDQLQPNNDLPRYGTATALSVVVIVGAGALSATYRTLAKRTHRYQVVTGQGYRSHVAMLGRHAVAGWWFLGFYFVVSKLLPLLIIMWAAAIPSFQAPSVDALQSISLQNVREIPWDAAFDAVRNTCLLMVITPTLTLACAIAFSWVILRSKVPGRLAFDSIAFLPDAIPNTIFSLAMLLSTLFLLQSSVPLFGTLWNLVIAFVIARIGYATRLTSSAFMQIHGDLEDAAMTSGLSTGSTVRRIVLPLIRPTLLYAWLCIAIMSFRELTLAVVLTTRDNLTLPVMVWSVWQSGGLGSAAAMTVFLLTLMIPMIALYWYVIHRTALRQV